MLVQMMFHPAKNKIHKNASLQPLERIDIGFRKPPSSVTRSRPDKLCSLCVKSVCYQKEVKPRETADMHF